MSARRRQLAGATTQVATQVSINFGSALAGLLIPIVGTFAVVAARQLVVAATVVPIARPNLRELGWRALAPAIALGVVLAIMNLSFYESVARLGLGIAAPIEFLGPLALAIAASRRLLDAACALAAGVGVFLLVGETGEFDLVGVTFALTAAAAWAAYILLTRSVAQRLEGLQGLAVASIVSLTILAPITLFVVDFTTFTWSAIALLVLGGVLASAVPYSLDTYILRRITPRLYAIITSFGPVIAAFWGWILLSETFTPVQVAAILVICGAAALAISTQKEHPMPSNFSMKAMNAGHRFLLWVTRGTYGWNAGGMPVLELTTTGRLSGKQRSTMLTAPLVEGSSYVVVASRGGDDVHPAWFLNLRDNPEVSAVIEGGNPQLMTARIATPEERARMWPIITATYANYAGYQERTEREIPLVLLSPR